MRERILKNTERELLQCRNITLNSVLYVSTITLLLKVIIRLHVTTISHPQAYFVNCVTRCYAHFGMLPFKFASVPLCPSQILLGLAAIEWNETERERERGRERKSKY